MADAFNALLKHVIAGGDLAREQTHELFNQLMDGKLTEPQIAGLLVALAAKGETVDEITGAAQAMRDHMVRIDTGGADVIDTCGTGGTGLKTFNISTAAAIVCAGAGAKVAKHGNRTTTRASGSADVLTALGVNLDATPDIVAKCLAEANVCFCFAVKCHPAMKFAVPVRKALGVRTIFNVLGPLTNPAGAKRQVMGVFDAALTETIANVHASLGSERAMILHADDGLDEISTTSPTKISELKDGKVTTRTVQPEDVGLARAKMDDLLVTSSDESAEIIRGVLSGKGKPAARDIVLINAAAALTVADKADDLAGGLTIAAESVDSGAAEGALAKLVEISNG
ncbi:MAG: anthranilate phosphoribosyltransferase [Planctomycetota bacterium]|jgi:anthranilate phosphoribosyltransferase